MLDRTKHENTMRNILDKIYSHKDLSSKLGFKGGTACYFFYNLPRFSTDLDFNLLDLNKKEEVFESLYNLLSGFGEVRDRYIKTNTIFFYLVHTKGRSGIKIEISKRAIEQVNSYDLRAFYGTSVLVMKKEDIFANKIISLTNRHSATPRDLFDVHYFFESNWDINEEIIVKVLNKSLVEYLREVVDFINKKFSYSSVHLGLGELVEDDSQRYFIKNKLIDATINHIQFYIDSKTRAEGF